MDSRLALEEVGDIIANMLRQESTTYKRTDYLSLAQPFLATKGETIDGAWRQRIIEWMYGVVDHCNLRRESVAVATYFLDLSASRGLVESRRDFQLIAMTSLVLSIKLYGSTLVKLDSMVRLGRGLFNEADVIAMETKMLRAFKWHVHPPTPVCFMRQMLRLLPAETSPVARYMIVEVTRFISEISACLYKFIKFMPSSMAFAGVIIAMERLDLDTLPVWERQEFMHNVTSATGLESKTPEVLRAVDELRLSLDNNVNLQELMRTIDAQCQVGHAKTQCKESKEPDMHAQSLHSPRDVATSVFH